MPNLKFKVMFFFSWWILFETKRGKKEKKTEKMIILVFIYHSTKQYWQSNKKRVLKRWIFFNIICCLQDETNWFNNLKSNPFKELINQKPFFHEKYQNTVWFWTAWKRYHLIHFSLAIQREQFLKEKAEEQERYKKALETQVGLKNLLFHSDVCSELFSNSVFSPV